MSLVACGGGSVSLSDFPGTELTLIGIPATPEDRGLELVLFSSDGACPELRSSVRASINGHALELTRKGGSAPGLLPFVPSCERPTFTTTLGTGELGLDAEVTTIEVRDETATFLFEVAGLMQERRLQLVQPADRQLRGSGEVVMEPVPATVRVDGQSPYVYGAAGAFVPYDCSPTQAWSLAPEQVSTQGNVLRFTVPAISQAGAGFLNFSASGSAEVRRCEGPRACHARVEFFVSERVTLLGPGGEPPAPGCTGQARPDAGSP
ncbi:MAG TPA: hypothetical protein VF794_28030 [Archangium sp.]|jgi:hypothetical protein|uniref:hypothetical protein n=1 Tax=Archangium sp. TaxID=1872627 RepID=UPI002ED9D740